MPEDPKPLDLLKGIQDALTGLREDLKAVKAEKEAEPEPEKDADGGWLKGWFGA